MNPAHLLPLLALAACAATPPLVTTTGTIPASVPAPGYTVTGDTPAASEVRRQLAARNTAAGPTIIRVGFATTPRQVGICTAPANAVPNTAAKGCAEWLDAPQSGFAPFAPKQRYRLTLALDTGSITVLQPASGKTVPIAAMVSAALAALPPSAAPPTSAATTD
ncbi:hypothetical protein GCM10011529_27020 [Polymorphobacter glacialis]|uniref:Uncharacterized protein n=1 Tax=Sandarakinorhabdus glacialis TaxID=1614636 RepID=A0A916ZYG2_9SPHN|nr:hypothetical protein [Polymorphobacter glacialis]GGE19106.1 hypothetical protein GCM10011529_27020 [Polymorphobacter glacialis]